MAATVQSGKGQGHLADKLEKQLNEIVRTRTHDTLTRRGMAWHGLCCFLGLLTIIVLQLVQMGRTFQARAQRSERMPQIILNAEKKMGEATDSFHSTLDEMEMEIVSHGSPTCCQTCEHLRAHTRASYGEASSCPD